MLGPSKNLSNIMPWNGFCIVFHNLSMQTGLSLKGRFYFKYGKHLKLDQLWTDLLGRTKNDMSFLISNTIDILSVDIDPDGLSFFPENITADGIADDAEYKGIRILFPARLDTIS